MKRNNMAALCAVVLVLLTSCQLFTPKPATPANPLLGNWKIDSIASGSDSSAFGYLLLAMSVDDSADYDLRFDKDTVTFFGKGSGPEKTPYAYLDTAGKIVLKDPEQDTFLIRSLNDSTTGLQGQDSSIIFLKKR